MALSMASLLLPALGCSAQDEAGTAAVVEAPPPEQKQNPAPDFTLPDVHGNEVSLADYRGKVVVIDFWATWCPPCIFQVPELNQLWSAHKEAGDVAVVGVAVDVEGAEVVAPWIEQEGVEYQILLGDERLAREFGAMGFPTLAIITPEGNIESLHVGLIELDELESLVAPFAGAG
jgi:peroxiredoxin